MEQYLALRTRLYKIIRIIPISVWANSLGDIKTPGDHR